MKGYDNVVSVGELIESACDYRDVKFIFMEIVAKCNGEIVKKVTLDFNKVFVLPDMYNWISETNKFKFHITVVYKDNSWKIVT